MARKKVYPPAARPAAKPEPITDQAIIGNRLSDLAMRIWQVRGVIGGAYSSVCGMERGECSDAANALQLASGLLDEIAAEVADAHKPDAKVAEVIRG